MFISNVNISKFHGKREERERKREKRERKNFEFICVKYKKISWRVRMKWCRKVPDQ